MPDEQSLIAEALRLKAENPSWGYIKIGAQVGLHKDKVRRAVEHAERKRSSLPAVINSDNALFLYDGACRALGEARNLVEVKDILNRTKALETYSRLAKDRTLHVKATELVVAATRRLGQMITVEKSAGRISRGQPPKNPSEMEEFSRTTLEAAGISHKLSSHAQKLASISDRAIEARLSAFRERVEREPGRVSIDILKDGPINGARSVMASRVDRDDDHALDYYPTPPWATRALFEHVLPEIPGGLISAGKVRLRSIWEPACGEGHMLRVIEEYTDRVDGSDIYDYGGLGADSIIDFVDGHDLDKYHYDWIITNPPFKDGLTERFVLRALDLAQVGVAMFVRSQWAVEGVDRYERIFRDRPPTLHAYFVERVPLALGRWNPEGATATAYCWLVWVKDRAPMAPFWIPPGCRESLTKPDDRARFAAWSMAEAAE